MTRFQRIPSVTGQAAARRLMINHLALSIYATSAYARILALIIYTSFCVNAIRVLNAFWSASLVRISRVIRQTGARTSSVSFFADCICTAR